jgi:sigma-B regulation protein RsbU (phosphoserine phosphatase)
MTPPLRKNDPHEVKLAGQVQKLLLPKTSPTCGWCSMSAKNRMANVLGGDFYDIIGLDDGCQVIFVGDVTGHGLHASIVMSLVYGFIHRAVLDVYDPLEVISELNTFLRTFARRSEVIDHYFSTTLFFGVIDPRSFAMTYVNAGHPAGLVLRDGNLLRLSPTGHPVGFFDLPEFRMSHFQFAEHDRLLLYTDGLIDSSNLAGEMFGQARLDAAFRRLDDDHMVFLERLFAEVSDFQAGHASFDDCTAIVVDIHGSLSHATRGE